MRLLSTGLVALFLLASNSITWANKWLDESIGNWNFVWVEKVGKQRYVIKGHRKYWKLANGTYRSRDSFNVKKPGTYVSEVWEYPNGTSKTLDYENGSLYGTGEGTWRMEDRKTIHSSTFRTPDGEVTYDGYTRRITRNKWITSMKVNPGNIKVTITATRTKKNKR